MMVNPSISYSGLRIRRCSSTGFAMDLISSGVTKSRPWLAPRARPASRRAWVARGPAPTSTLLCSRVPRTISTTYLTISSRTWISFKHCRNPARASTVSTGFTEPPASTASGASSPRVRQASVSSSSFSGVSILILSINLSFWASGSGYVPSYSIGFCVAKTVKFGFR